MGECVIEINIEENLYIIMSDTKQFKVFLKREIINDKDYAL